MKILLASPFGGVQGGISRWTCHINNYYKTLHDPLCEMDLLPMGRSTFVNVNSSIFYRIISAIRDYRVILKEYRKYLQSSHYDIMHLASSASISLLKDLYMLRRAKAKGIKTIIHFHFGRIPDLYKKQNWEWKLLTRVLKNADRAIVLDRLSYETLQSCGIVNVSILPNPVAPEVNMIIASNKELSRESNTILFIGHVVKTKGVFELVEACNQLPNVSLKLVGYIEDDMKMSLNERAKCCLEIMGEMSYEDVIKEMMKCDIFVLPTYTEGFPNVILESMAAGCAIVATDVGAIPEMLGVNDKKRYALIVKPKDETTLKDAIELLLTDDKLKLEFRSNVSQRVNELYSIDKVWEQLFNLWESI